MNYKDGRTLKIYYCKECGNKIHWHTRSYGMERCRSCSRKGDLNPFKGKYNITEEFLIKEYINNKKSMKKIANIIGCSWFTIRYKLKKYEIKLRNRSEINTGKSNPMFNKPCPSAKAGFYEGIHFRSSWEILFAQFLDLSNIKWLYESKRFYCENFTYCPDFYIPEWDLYIEIKGWWRGNTKEKFNLFCKKYSNIKTKVLMKNDLDKLGILNN